MNVSAQELVSVIIPCYNAELYIRECLVSVMAQDYKNLEIIVIDDGSTDQSVSIAETELGKDARAILVRNKNHGVAYSRNAGLEHSTGDFIFFLDADDVLPSDSISELVKCASTSNADMVYGSYSVMDGATERMIKEFNSRNGDVIPCDYAFEALLSVKPDTVSGSCWRILFKSVFLSEHGIVFPEGVAMSEDYCFILDCLEKNPLIVYTDALVYQLRRGSVSATQGYIASLRHDMEYVNSRLLNACSKRAMIRDYKSLYKLNVGNTVWVICRNEAKNPFISMQERRRSIFSVLREYRSTLRSLPKDGMPLLKLAILKLGGWCPYLVSLILSRC